MKAKQGLYVELLNQYEERFRQHLSVPNNDRIIFSGKFGHGKTTFLKEFFCDENQQEANTKVCYNVISLNPVNYSVATNEDIFKYIKHDIILEMLDKGYEIEEDVKSYLKTLPVFLKKNAHKVLASLIFMIPKVGKDVVESFEKLDSLKEEFFEFHDSKQQNELDILQKYIDHFEAEEGGLFENDIITNLIQKILQRKKVEKENTQNILLIDDLDRIDPEHIFRILNVFSAHFNEQLSYVKDSKPHNKFDFDKIIIVCDVDNIREIFKAKYGIKTDFNGYIDKFYSHTIFDFNNREVLKEIAISIVNKANWSREEHKDSSEYKYRLFENERIYIHQFMYYSLSMLIENRQLQLRSILKYSIRPFHISSYFQYQNSSLSPDENPLITCILMLAQLKGGYAALKNSLSECSLSVTIPDSTLKEYLRDLVVIAKNTTLKNLPQGTVIYNLNTRTIELEKKNNKYFLSENLLEATGFTQSDFIHTLIDAIKVIENSSIPIK